MGEEPKDQGEPEPLFVHHVPADGLWYMTGSRIKAARSTLGTTAWLDRYHAQRVAELERSGFRVVEVDF